MSSMLKIVISELHNRFQRKVHNFSIGFGWGLNNISLRITGSSQASQKGSTTSRAISSFTSFMCQRQRQGWGLAIRMINQWSDKPEYSRHLSNSVPKNALILKYSGDNPTEKTSAQLGAIRKLQSLHSAWMGFEPAQLPPSNLKCNETTLECKETALSNKNCKINEAYQKISTNKKMKSHIK